MIILIEVNWLKVIYEIGHQKIIVLLVYFEFGGAVTKAAQNRFGLGGPSIRAMPKKKGVFLWDSFPYI